MIVWALCAAVAPFFYIFSDLLEFANYPVGISVVLRITGVVLFVVAIWLLHASHRDLGRSWTPRAEAAGGTALVTAGIYSKVRHPMYAAHLAWGIAQTLIFPNFLAGVGGLVVMVLLLSLRIPREEQALVEEFGEAYRTYKAKTGRFLPRRFIAESNHRE
jgi:protein-S-isoprenylcysteine O-methyltransferase Ste14